MAESRPRSQLPGHIADVGTRACYQQSFGSVGMSRIAELAGVSKRTLYKYFPSPSAVVAAGLRRRSDNWMSRLAAAGDTDPKARVLALFDALTAGAGDAGYRGCWFVSAAVQSPEENVRLVAREHKKRLLATVRDAAAAAGVAFPDRFAARMMVLVEGALASAAVAATGEPVDTARGLLCDLLEAETEHQEVTRRDD
jgi:AcrR family transcriptional regulator